METLIIVRRIREAESLAASGHHDDAESLLEPLLAGDGLSETHRTLIRKKIDLFKRQKDRLTRIISRRATAIHVDDPSDESSDRTAIRAAISGEKQTIVRSSEDDKSERPTGPAAKVPGSENPTESVPTPKSFKPGTLMLTPDMLRPASFDDPQTETEVPRLPDNETEAPGKPQHETEIPSLSKSNNTYVKPDYLPQSIQDDDDSKELAPLADDSDLSSMPDSSDGLDPRETDIFEARFERKKTRTIYRKREDIDTGGVEKANDEVPTLVRSNIDKPVLPSNDTPAGWHDTPPVKVTDSIIMPQVPKISQDSAFIEASDYLMAPSDSGKSSPELKALAHRLPDDDLRRELALEVVQLREKMAKMEKRESKRHETRAKLDRNQQPESGQFHIPASQVNTIVRYASGGKGIDVHMPTRDEDIEDLAVLRKDSVRGEKVREESTDAHQKRSPTDRIELASGYLDEVDETRPNLWRPVGLYLGFLVIVLIVCWAVYLGVQAMAPVDSTPVGISAAGIGGHTLRDDITKLKASADWAPDAPAKILKSKDGRYCLRYGDDNKLISVAIKLGSEDSLTDFEVDYLAQSFGMSSAGSINKLLTEFGSREPTPPFSENTFSVHDEDTLAFVDSKVEPAVVLEFHYSSRDAKHPDWVQLRLEAATSITPVFHKVEK
ncbi:MAG: hypothetical protein L3J82_01205 [Planctomycetes bacterium]|nr:hypothetical protein [Planctomycetota bacterium]